MTGVNRAWGKSTTPIPDFPQGLFVRVNIGAQQQQAYAYQQEQQGVPAGYHLVVGPDGQNYH